MEVGFFGLGKLGLATALSVEARGHRVCGFDPSPEVAANLAARRVPYREEGVDAALACSRLELVTEAEVVRRCGIVFVAIQTPHAPGYEGVTRMPAEPADFDYSHLCRGLARVFAEIESLGRPRVVAVVSTVLPGTLRRLVLPLAGKNARVCYNPSFVAMGTALRDLSRPEFVLVGADDAGAADAVEAFHRTLHDAPVHRAGIESAELAKVLYNTYISTKIAFANTAMELCHGTPGADVDAVLGALALGSRRIVSPSYLSGGMGDGGGCHPRDNMALRHLSRRLSLSYDWFDAVMSQRERQTDWLASLVEKHAAGRPVWILGQAFKAGSDLTAGSPALLLRGLLEERGVRAGMWDPHVPGGEAPPVGVPLCYFIGTRHPEFRVFAFNPGSVVLDPWRYLPPRPGVELVPIGVGPRVEGTGG